MLIVSNSFQSRLFWQKSIAEPQGLPAGPNFKNGNQVPPLFWIWDASYALGSSQVSEADCWKLGFVQNIWNRKILKELSKYAQIHEFYEFLYVFLPAKIWH